MLKLEDLKQQQHDEEVERQIDKSMQTNLEALKTSFARFQLSVVYVLSFSRTPCVHMMVCILLVQKIVLISTILVTVKGDVQVVYGRCTVSL